MRTLAITQNVSADGSPELLGDWFDPGDQADDLTAEMRRQSETEAYILLGRKTFIDFRSYWPHQTEDPTGFTELLNNQQKLVVSSTLGDPEWQNSTVLGADWRDRVKELKAEDGGDIVCTGSLTLCDALLTEGLADELRLFVFPAVQGRGRRLVPEGYERRLRLVDSKAFVSGVVLLVYSLL